MAKVKAQPVEALPVSDRLAEPDLVDLIFGYLLEVCPDLAARAGDLGAAKEAMRQEFGGERFYVRSGRDGKRAEKVAQVLSLFNGRNATEVARTLQISRAEVYRRLKQAGRTAA